MERPDPEGMTDRELAEELAARGTEWAFRELYGRHTPRLLQLILRIIAGTAAEAEDLVQETWLRATGKLEQFRWESSFGTWLCGIGINVSRDYLRRRARRKEVGLTLVPTAAGRPPDAGPELSAIDVDRALVRLPDGYRTVLVLHDIEGLTHKEVAAMLRISVGTSKSQLSEARRALRRLLQPRMEKERDERQMA